VAPEESLKIAPLPARPGAPLAVSSQLHLWYLVGWKENKKKREKFKI